MCVLLINAAETNNAQSALTPELQKAGIRSIVAVESAEAALSQIANSQSPQFLIALGDVKTSAQAIQSMIEGAQTKREAVIASGIFNASELMSDPSSILNEIFSLETMPGLWLIPTQALRSLSLQNALSFTDIVAEIILRLGQNAIEIESSSINLSKTFNNGLKSSFMKAALSCCNIEELFPNHAWQSHQEESVAACYHELAARFIRLDDLESAEDCLKQSERFEESPRALALKALISKRHGEILGAVAHMVSSLQQYEQRKTATDSHYLSFNPNNIEKINTQLEEGLSALNKRDNESALNKFTEAVFNFDSFYNQMGLN